MSCSWFSKCNAFGLQKHPKHFCQLYFSLCVVINKKLGILINLHCLRILLKPADDIVKVHVKALNDLNGGDGLSLKLDSHESSVEIARKGVELSLEDVDFS